MVHGEALFAELTAHSVVIIKMLFFIKQVCFEHSFLLLTLTTYKRKECFSDMRLRKTYKSKQLWVKYQNTEGKKY